MAFTKVTADPANIAALADRPKQNNGLSAAQVKAKFDKAGVDLKTYLNDVLTEELERTTDGDSGADNIGATAVGDGTATTVQGILEEIDADATALDGAVVHKTGNETIDDVKTFSSSPIVPAPTTDMQAATKKYVDDTDGARKTYVDNLDALAVHLAGTETITGVKTFSASPIVPAPVSDTHPATKKYVDDADVLKVNITDIVNDLTETTEGKVLDARQGKALSDKIGAQTYTENNYITDAEPLTTSIDKLDMQAKDTADLVSTNSALLKFTATNLLANSNFATASGGVATGWINGSAISGVSVADNIQYFTGAGALGATSNNHLSQPSKLNKLNHYYYLRVSAKRVSGSAALQFYLGTTYRTLVADVLEDDFKEYSVVFKQTSSTNIDFTLGADSGLAVGVQYAYACDLTETFGEQYIPDKPEIQSLMSLHENNWFDGEKQLAGLKDVYNVGAKNNRKDRVKIYGVKFTGSNPVGERTHDAVGMVAEVGVDDQLVQNDFDNVDFYNRPRCNVYHAPDGSPIVMAYEGEPGFSLTGGIFPPYADLASVFYECKPCAWNGSFDEPQITGTPMEGFELFECFPDWNTKIYLPSYWMATVDGKPTSISGVHPTPHSLNTAMTSARNYHANGHLETTATHMYEYILQLVEFATRDVQTVMMGASTNTYNGASDIIATVESDTVFTAASTVGARFVVGQTISIGNVQNGSNRTSTAVIQSIVTEGDVSMFTLEAAVSTMEAGDFISTRAWRNGATDIVAASSGSPVSNTSGKYPCIWRGKVDPWAMAYSFLCDLLIQRSGEGTTEDPYTYTPYYLPDPTKYAAGAITEDYIKLNLSLPGSDGYASSLGTDKRYRFAVLTSTLGASSTTWLAAYYYYPRYAVCAVRVGGYWYDGRDCSPVYFGCNAQPSGSSIGSLARLSVRRN